MRGSMVLRLRMMHEMVSTPPASPPGPHQAPLPIVNVEQLGRIEAPPTSSVRSSRRIESLDAPNKIKLNVWQGTLVPFRHYYLLEARDIH